MKWKNLFKRVGTTLLLAAISLSAIPPITSSAADSLRGESVYQIMVDRFYDGDPANNAAGESRMQMLYSGRQYITAIMYMIQTVQADISVQKIRKRARPN